MKKLKFIYALFIALLWGFAVSSCEDDENFAADEETTDASYSGEMVNVSFTVGVTAPNVNGDIDVPVSRAAGDNANIDYACMENGGRFQNLILLLVDDKDTIKGVHCKKWYTDDDNPNAVGVKEYSYIFRDIAVEKKEVDNVKFKVYAFANLCVDHYSVIEAQSRNSKVGNLPNKWPRVKDYCLQLNLIADDVYDINFIPGSTQYYVKETSKYYVNTSDVAGKIETKCTGMPVNGIGSEIIVKGNTNINVGMKRVCARLHVTFRNFTGTYVDFDTKASMPNNVYVDQFEIPGILTNKTNCFSGGTAPSDKTISTFKLSELFKKSGVTKYEDGADFDKDHIKILNDGRISASMYVFETTRTTDYAYNLKLDRGKNLGVDTKTLQEGNAYVIWNQDSKKLRALAFKSPSIFPSEQTEYDEINFKDQVFWELVKGTEDGVYALRHYPIDLITDKYDKSKDDDKDVYLKQQEHGKTMGVTYAKDFVKTPSYGIDGCQYVYFDRSNAQYGILFCKDASDTNHKLNGSNHFFLTVTNNKELENKCEWNDKTTHYDWTLYAKYIIRNDNSKDSESNRNNILKFKKDGEPTASSVKAIVRNDSYDIDFSVVPNEVDKQELLVSCKRVQDEVELAETQK